MAENASPHADVVPVEQADPAALAGFFSATWNAEATAEVVMRSHAASAASNPVRPGRAPTAVAFVLDGRIIGYLGSIPARFWNGTTEQIADWLKGFMVLPEHRNGPVGHMLLRALTKRVDLAGVLVVAEPARRLMSALGYKDLGTLSNRVSVLRYGRVASRVRPEGLGFPAFARPFFGVVRTAQRTGLAYVLGATGGLGIRLWHRLRRVGTRGFTISVGELNATDQEIDGLWQTFRAGIANSAVRDARYLRWRYTDAQNGAYVFVLLREESRLQAIAVVRHPTTGSDDRLAGIRLSTLSEIIFPVDRKDVGVEAVSAARRVALHLGADAMLCSGSHPVLDAVLAESGFVAMGGTVHFHLRVPKGTDSFSFELGDWWLTRGDANSDEGV